MANRKEAVRFGGRTSRETADGRSGRLGRILVSLALALVVLVFLAAIGFLVLQIVGKNRLYSSASGEELLVFQQLPVAERHDGSAVHKDAGPVVGLQQPQTADPLLRPQVRAV